MILVAPRLAQAALAAACAAILSATCPPARAADAVPTDARSLHVALRALPAADLRALYLRCARASATLRLPPETMAACSAGGEVLLHEQFGGDFDALIAWWKAQEARREDAGDGPLQAPAADPLP